MWGIIATWRMAHDGILAAKRLLEEKSTCGDAVETAIKCVEDYPFYKSVGYGGLPNERGIVEMDAAFSWRCCLRQIPKHGCRNL